MLIKYCWMHTVYEGIPVTVSAQRYKMLPNWNLSYVWLYHVGCARHVLFSFNNVQLFTSCSWYWKILIKEEYLTSQWKSMHCERDCMTYAATLRNGHFKDTLFLLHLGIFFYKENIFWCLLLVWETFSWLILTKLCLAHSLRENIRQWYWRE